MDRNGLVSVILPVYNTLPYLPEAIESVINQTYGNLEIIVVDDGSTDGSGKICDSYAEKDKRIRVIHQKNLGLSAARNTGLDLMKGEAVAFIDSDDAYHPDFIAKLKTAMLEENADIAMCKYTVEYSTGKMALHDSGKRMPPTGPGRYSRVSALRALADRSMDHVVWNKLYRRGLWNDLRYPAAHVYEDVDTTYRVINRSSLLCVLDDSLYLKRSRTGSISITYSPENTADWQLAFSHFESFIEANIPDLFSESQLTDIRKRRFQRLIRDCAYYHWRNRRRDRSFSRKIRTEVMEAGKNADIQGLDRKTGRYYRIICFRPWLLKAVGLVYYPAWKLKRKFIRR